MEVQELMRPLVAAVPLHQVIIEKEVGPGHGDNEHEFGNRFEMFGTNKIFHILHRAANHCKYHNHRAHARVQSADNEVRPKDSRIPAGSGGGGKIPGHDGVYREHNRDDRERKDVHCITQMCPFSLCTPKTKR